MNSELNDKINCLMIAFKFWFLNCLKHETLCDVAYHFYRTSTVLDFFNDSFQTKIWYKTTRILFRSIKANFKGTYSEVHF